MLLHGEHDTRYSYSAGVRLGTHILRLRPRQDAWQRILNFEIDISPQPAGQAWGLDAEGNSYLQVWWLGETHHLRIRSRFEVEALRQNPFDFLPGPGAASLPPVYSSTELALLEPYMSGSAQGPGTTALTDRIRGESDGTVIDFLLHIASTIYREVEQTVREHGAPHEPEETVRLCKGSCRDMAVLFNAVCRAEGIPSRFVSGYERAAASADSAYMHAWSEVYLPSIGWRGFDPSRGMAIQEGHVAVAAGRVPQSAAPVEGSYQGPGASTLEHRVMLFEEE